MTPLCTRRRNSNSLQMYGIVVSSLRPLSDGYSVGNVTRGGRTPTSICSTVSHVVSGDDSGGAIGRPSTSTRLEEDGDSCPEPLRTTYDGRASPPEISQIRGDVTVLVSRPVLQRPSSRRPSKQVSLVLLGTRMSFCFFLLQFWIFSKFQSCVSHTTFLTLPTGSNLETSGTIETITRVCDSRTVYSSFTVKSVVGSSVRVYTRIDGCPRGNEKYTRYIL